MFLHLGGDMVVHQQEVIAILSVQLLKKTEANKEFVRVSEEDGFVNYISEKEDAKSFIITNKGVYFSPISSTTLKKRSDEVILKYNRD